MNKWLAEVLEERIALVGAALTQIVQPDQAQAGLRELQDHLPKLLELIECDPGVRAAASDLLAAATALAEEDPGGRSRLVREAYQRFQDRLRGTRLNERARVIGFE